MDATGTPTDDPTAELNAELQAKRLATAQAEAMRLAKEARAASEFMEDDARAFLVALMVHVDSFAPPPNAVMQIVGIKPDGVPTMHPIAVGDVDGAIDICKRLVEEGSNVYTELRLIDRTGLTDTQRGTKETTAGVFAFVIDLDADKGLAKRPPLQPSMAVETSPRNGHVWYLTDRLLSLAEAEAIDQRVAAAGIGDPSHSGITQPYRIPGTPNFPNAVKVARGRKACGTFYRPEGCSLAPYSADALLAAFPAAPAPSTGQGQQLDRSADDTVNSALLGDILGRLDAGSPGDGRQKEIVALRGAVLAATAGQDYGRDVYFEAFLRRRFPADADAGRLDRGWRRDAKSIQARGPAMLFDKAAKMLGVGVAAIWDAHKCGAASIDDPNAAALRAHAEQLKASMASAFGGVQQHDATGAVVATGSAIPAAGTASAVAVGLVLMRASDLHGRPVPPRRHLVGDVSMIPLRQVSYLTGNGGEGKSRLALQLAVAVASDTKWLDLPIDEPGSVLYVGTEDDFQALHAAFAEIAQATGVPLERLDNLHFCALDAEAAFVKFNPKERTLSYTETWAKVQSAIETIKPKLIVLDTVAGIFDAPENERALVRQFVMALRRLAESSDGAVLLVGHPSLTGMQSGSGISGSTDWHNAVRCRLYLQPDDEGDEPNPNGRILDLTKNQYAPSGTRWKLERQNGVFIVTETGAVTAAATPEEKRVRAKAADEAFMKCMTQLEETGASLSASPDAQANKYAPKVIAKMLDDDPVLGKLPPKARLDRLERAMSGLLRMKRLHIVEEGPPSKSRKRLRINPDYTPPVIDPKTGFPTPPTDDDGNMALPGGVRFSPDAFAQKTGAADTGSDADDDTGSEALALGGEHDPAAEALMVSLEAKARKHEEFAEQSASDRGGAE